MWVGVLGTWLGRKWGASGVVEDTPLTLYPAKRPWGHCWVHAGRRCGRQQPRVGHLQRHNSLDRPEMMAPACPMRRPGGAVRPAMKDTTGLVVPLARMNSAASSSAEPPISPGRHDSWMRQVSDGVR
jgi:hypothetical protein